MSLHFRHIRIKDWMVYQGAGNEMFLPDFEENRNLVIVNGRNGFGKTSFLQALKFAFGGKLSTSELIKKWNNSSRKTGDGSLEISVEFLHNDKVYSLLRRADIKLNHGKNVCVPSMELYLNGELQSQSDDKIEELLPRECLEFIFFDGAEIKKYAQKTDDGDSIRIAIEKRLGIPAIKNLRDDMSRLEQDVANEQESLLLSHSELEPLIKELEKLKDDLDIVKERKEEEAVKRDTNEKIRTELSREAAKFEITAAEQKKLEESKAKLAELNERCNEVDRSILASVKRLPLFLLRNYLSQAEVELKAKIAPSQRSKNRQAKVAVLREIIEEGVCICGNSLSDDECGRLEKQANDQERHLARTPDTEDLNDWGAVSTILQQIRRDEVDGTKLLDRRQAIEDQIEETEADIGKLKKGLQNHENADIKDIYMQLGSIESTIKDCTETINSYAQDIKRLEADIRAKQREVDAKGEEENDSISITRLRKECEKISNAVTDLVKQLVEEKRKSIEEKATELFTRITNKSQEYERINVSEQYELAVCRRDGSKVEAEQLSAGEKEVVAYSFITALNLASIAPAPFILDTPFGHLDSVHREGLLRSLPNLPVQVFLLATDRDLPPAERNNIDSRIAKEFTLLRDQNHAFTTISEGTDNG